MSFVPTKNSANTLAFVCIDLSTGLPSNVPSVANTDITIMQDFGSTSNPSNGFTNKSAGGLYTWGGTSGEWNCNVLNLSVVKTGYAFQLATSAYTSTTGVVPSDTQYANGSAVQQSGGYFQVDVEKFGNSAGSFSGGIPAVNVSQFGGSNGTFAAGIPAVNSSQISGSTPSTVIQTAAAAAITAAEPIPSNITQVAGTAVGTAWPFTFTGSLVNASVSGSGLTPSAIATAVWTYPRSDIPIGTRSTNMGQSLDAAYAYLFNANDVNPATSLQTIYNESLVPAFAALCTTPPNLVSRAQMGAP